MESYQIIAWLVSIAQKSMAERGVEQLDGIAISAILSEGSEYPAEAAVAIQRLTGTP